MFNALDWLLVSATFTGIISLILVVILHFKVRTLFLLLASSGHTRAAGIDNGNPPTLLYPPTSSPVPTPTVDYMYYHRTIQRLFPVDLTLLLCLILFIIVCFGYLYFKYKKSIARRTSLMLEISDGQSSYTYAVTSLAYPPSFYRFTVSQQLIDITLKEFHRQVTLIDDTLQLPTKCGVQSRTNMIVTFSATHSRSEFVIVVPFLEADKETQTENHLVDSAAQTEYDAALATIARYFESMEQNSVTDYPSAIHITSSTSNTDTDQFSYAPLSAPSHFSSPPASPEDLESSMSSVCLTSSPHQADDADV